MFRAVIHLLACTFETQKEGMWEGIQRQGYAIVSPMDGQGLGKP